MNILSMDELQNLVSPHEGWCISIYMPTIGKSQQVRQNPIRYRNLLDRAGSLLREAGMEEPEIAELFEPLEALQNDDVLWQHQDKSLAVFCAKNFFQTYQLPMAVDETVLVNERFYVKPLIPLIHEEQIVYVLALSQKHTRLLKATEDQIEELEVPNLPENMQEALGYESYQQFIEWQTNTPQRNNSGEAQTLYNGHSEGTDNRKDYILNYFRKIDQAVTSYLNKENKAPLIIASVEYLKPIYEEANTYENLADELIPGNPDGLKGKQLQEEVWKLAKPMFQASKEDITEQYKILSGRKDPRVQKDLAEVIKAAPYGRVEVLYVDKNAKKWGSFDENNIEVHFDDQQRPGSEDLLDFAAVQTLLHGGTVHIIDPQDMPEKGTPVAAIFRY